MTTSYAAAKNIFAAGTGLGLPVCYSIAARHQARIDFETNPNGTVFFLGFPFMQLY